MKNIINKIFRFNSKALKNQDEGKLKERLLFAAQHSKQELFSKFTSSDNGLSETFCDFSREEFGKNIVVNGKKESVLKNEQNQ